MLSVVFWSFVEDATVVFLSCMKAVDTFMEPRESTIDVRFIKGGGLSFSSEQSSSSVFVCSNDGFLGMTGGVFVEIVSDNLLYVGFDTAPIIWLGF